MTKKATQEKSAEEAEQQNAEALAAEQAAENLEPALEQVIEQLRSDLAVAKDQMLRVAADAENAKRRAAKEVEDANKYGVSSFAKDLISVVENLQRTTDSIPEEGRTEGLTKNLYEGVEIIKQELLGIFERRGIKRVDPQAGEKFDPNYHQAMAQVEDHKIQAGHVVQSLQAGYVIQDRLLRPALVTVCKGGASESKINTTA